ncbi:MAG: hypothetical protein HND49_00650 [Planctomycetes bacterium]|nr:hypothetical protein [Planctomycetota bacterium]
MIGLIVGLLIIITIIQTLAQRGILERELETRISLMKENIQVGVRPFLITWHD